MRARKFLFRVHLYTALASGLILSVTGLSGTVLVFRHEIDRFLLPQLFRVEPRPERVSADVVLAVVHRAFPSEKVRYLFPPTVPGDSYQVQLGDAGQRAYLDPHTGRLLGSRRPRETFTGFLYALHADLLGGGAGRTVVGATGVLLLLLGTTGLILWWPGRRRLAHGFRIRWRSNWKRINFDVHRVLGVLTVPLLTLSSVTGLALVFPAPFTWAVHAMTGVLARPTPPTCPVPSDARPLPLDALVRVADAALPGASTTRISLPPRPDAPVVIRKRFPAEAHVNGMNFVHIDPYSGRALAVEDVTQAPPGDVALNLRYPLHTGGLGGFAIRVLTALVGLAPAALMTTGGIMWWNRVQPRRQVRVDTLMSAP